MLGYSENATPVDYPNYMRNEEFWSYQEGGGLRCLLAGHASSHVLQQAGQFVPEKPTQSEQGRAQDQVPLLAYTARPEAAHGQQRARRLGRRLLTDEELDEGRGTHTWSCIQVSRVGHRRRPSPHELPSGPPLYPPVISALSSGHSFFR